MLVVGGGPVAARKVLRLLRSGARVTLVSPVATESLRALADAGAIQWEARGFRAGDVAGRTLVFTATGRADTDHAVVMAARAVGTLVNSADQACPGDFEVPALLERGPLQVTVSTSGAAPGFAAILADELGETLSEMLGDYVRLLDEARRALRAKYPEEGPARRSAFARALGCEEARTRAVQGDIEGARSLLWEAVGLPGPDTE